MIRASFGQELQREQSLRHRPQTFADRHPLPDLPASAEWNVNPLIAADRGVELSLVIPVFNGSDTIGEVVDQIHAVCTSLRFEVLLVNDGSSDASEETCTRIVQRHPDTVCLVQLARNFGEHNTVLAGLRYARGQYVAVLDDDGQNRPQDVLKMLAHAQQHKLDVVYGRYRGRQHPWPRILGSWFHNKIANFILGKPRNLYLSSFKVMSRFVVDEVVKFTGPFPYLDGLILRTTNRLGQIEVDHEPRRAGRSGYTLPKLVGLWLNMFVGFSIVPLRLALVLGTAAAGLSLLVLGGIVVDKLWINPQVTVGIPSVLASVVFFAGTQLVILGVLGEYLGRVFLHQNGMPQSVVRYLNRATPSASARQQSLRHNGNGGILVPLDRVEAGR
jgi:undecaprenyl-phosphate 4-deoxy-4-formamido-L-arabinose transferase